MNKDSPDGYGFQVSQGVSSFLSQDSEPGFRWYQYAINAGANSSASLVNSYEEYIYHLLGLRIMCVDEINFHAFLYRGDVYEGYVKVLNQYELFYPPGYNIYLNKNDYYTVNVFNPTAASHNFNVTFYYNKYIKPADWVKRPTAGLSVDDATPAVGQVVQFYDASTGDPTDFTWSFGDGSVSYLENPTHSYSAAGTYSVIHSAHNKAGRSYKSGTIVVT